MKKKNSLMPQTKANALFGPVFVATTPPVMYFIDYNYIYYKCQLASKKMKKEKKKTHLWPKQCPFTLLPPLPSCIS